MANAAKFRASYSAPLRLYGLSSMAMVAGYFLAPSRTFPQSQQQYVYASVPATTTTSSIAGFAKDGQTGSLSAVIGSPFPDAQLGQSMAIDGLGHFLFVLNTSANNVSMYQINSASGALTEVTGSPFSMGPTENPQMAASSPVCLAAERSGQFLYVGYQFGNLSGQGAVNQFLIDPTRQQLVPLPAQPTTDVPSSPIGMVVGTIGTAQYLYVGLGLNRTTGVQDAGTKVYRIDPISGALTPSGSGNAGNALSAGRSIAIDSQSRFFFDGWGTTAPAIDAALIAPDGTATTGISTVNLTSSEVPSAMLVDNGGKFLYVQQGGTAVVYSIDQSTGALVTPSSPLSTLNLTTAGAVADPLGPYLYSLQVDGIHGFQINPQTGALFEVAGSPFGGPLAQDGLAISGQPVQAVSGPIAALFPNAISFAGSTVGQSTNAHTVALTNTGDQSLSVTGIAVSGLNASDFAATPTCSVPTVLAPNSTCTISVVFTPGASGPRQASLMTTDNAPGSPQSVSLTGTGVAPQPAVTISPISLGFATTNQGSTSPAQTVTLTSAGSVPLHITSVLPSGSNPGDFQFTHSCSAPLTVGVSCSLSVTFSPLGSGQRTASIVVTDDAPDSPQSIQLTGTGAAPPPGTPVVKLSATAVSFANVTQGSTVSPQVVTLTSFGSATLHISSIVLGGSNPPDFTLTNNCTAAAYAVNATCTIGISVAPISLGLRTATVTIADDAPNSPQTIAISANVNPAFTVAPSSAGGNSATISAGQTATFSLQVNPGAGFAGSATWTCSGVPANATCNAPNLQIAGGNPITYTVSVVTLAGTQNTPWPVLPQLPQTPLKILLCSIWVLLLLLLVCGAIHRRTPREFAFASLLFLVLFCCSQVTGCGGGSVASPQSAPVSHAPGTPQGTSTITLTPSVTSSTGTPLPGIPAVQLTLIVK